MHIFLLTALFRTEMDINRSFHFIYSWYQLFQNQQPNAEQFVYLGTNIALTKKDVGQKPRMPWKNLSVSGNPTCQKTLRETFFVQQLVQFYCMDQPNGHLPTV